MKKHKEDNLLNKLYASNENSTKELKITYNNKMFNNLKSPVLTHNEALSKASNPQALEMNFKGIFLDEGRRILS